MYSLFSKKKSNSLYPNAHCTYGLLSRKPGFLLSAMHSRAFRWFSAAPLVFLFIGFLPLQLNKIWQILCVMYGEEGERNFVYLYAHLLFGPNFGYKQLQVSKDLDPGSGSGIWNPVPF
jgi:hypothetical protein